MDDQVVIRPVRRPQRIQRKLTYLTACLSCTFSQQVHIHGLELQLTGDLLNQTFHNVPQRLIGRSNKAKKLLQFILRPKIRSSAAKFLKIGFTSLSIIATVRVEYCLIEKSCPTIGGTMWKAS